MEKIDIKTYRQRAGKTQAECAKELGITGEYFSDIERGAVRPGAPLVIKIEQWSGFRIDKSTLRPDIWEAPYE